MPRAWLLFVLALSGCQLVFGLEPAQDVAPDAPTPGIETSRVFACDQTTLYEVDLEGRRLSPIGPIAMPGDSNTFYVEGLAAVEGRLYGLPGGSTEQLLEIDPDTAEVRSAVFLSSQQSFWGLTWSPEPAPGHLVAATDQGELYTITPGSTKATLLGTLGGDLAIAGDLSWDPVSRALWGTVRGGTCPGNCIAKIDPATGQASLVGSGGEPSDLWAVAAHAGGLFALGGNGTVYSIDRDTGTLTELFTTSPGSTYSDAAP